MIHQCHEWKSLANRPTYIIVFLTGYFMLSWWSCQMETFYELLALCVGNTPAPVNSPHKGKWCGALMFFLSVSNKQFSKNREAGDLRCHCAHNDVSVMLHPWTELKQTSTAHSTIVVKDSLRYCDITWTRGAGIYTNCFHMHRFVRSWYSLVSVTLTYRPPTT